MSGHNSTTKVPFKFRKSIVIQGYSRIDFFTGEIMEMIWMPTQEWEAFKTLLLNESNEAILVIDESNHITEGV